MSMVSRHAAASEDSALVVSLFLVVFPGFFLYHALVTRGLFPAALGGYAPAIAIITTPILAIVYLRRVLRSPAGFLNIDAAYFAFLGFFALVVLANVLLQANGIVTRAHLAVIPQLAVAFLLARLVDPRDSRFRWGVAISFAVLTSLILLNISGSAIALAALGVDPSGEGLADYQEYAFVYCVVATYVVATIQTAAWRRGLELVAIVALFAVGARSEFVGFVLAVGVIELCYARHRALLTVVLSLAAVLLLLRVGVLIELLPESRLLGLLEYGYDGSVLARREMAESAYRTIAANPLFGGYASYPQGTYAHNALSAWVDLGLVGFLLYVSPVLVAAGDLARRFRRLSRDPMYILALSSIAFVVVLIALAKTFTYQLVPVALGLYARVAMRESSAAAGA